MKRKALVLSALFCILFVSIRSLWAQISFFEPPSYVGTGGSNWAFGYGYEFGADFNGDGKPDLLTPDGTLNLGKGDGTFALGTNALGTSGLQVVGVADFNGDGKPDLLSGSSWDSPVQVLFGNGDGTFRTSGVIAGIPQGTIADMNGDGKADVVALENTSSNSTLFIYLGNGDGTFQTGVSYNLGSTVAWGVILLADFNGDNGTDILVSAPELEMVLLGNGNGTFQTPIISAGVSYPQDAAVGDFNNDGKLDLALSGALLLGNGDGTFQASVKTGAGGVAADFNGDGKLDLVGGTQVYLGNGDGTFSDTGHAYLVQSSSNTVIADFNGDGKLDIATGNTVLLGNGDGTFQGNPSSVGGPVGALEYWDAVAGDFNNDGAIDVAVACVDLIQILLNDGTGQLSLTHTYTLGVGLDDTIVTGDLNGDGNLDLIMASDQDNGEGYDLYFSVLLGNGGGSFQPVSYPMGNATAPAPPPVVVGDFNNDGRLDFAAGLSDSLFLGNGDGTFAPPIPMGAYPQVSADFNGDDKLDIAAVCDYHTSPGTALLFGNGDGTFQAPICATNLEEFGRAAFAVDLNNDGKVDLVSSALFNPSTPSQVALGNGDGTFTVLPALSTGIVALGELNGDGRVDAVYNTAGKIGVMLGNGDGTFGSPIDVFSTPFFRTVLVADMNRDGRSDLVFVKEGWGGVGVLLNTTPAGFGLFATAPSPSTVTPGNSATSTVNVIPTFGFNKTVTLSCTGLPTGATCAFNPPFVANSSGSSALTIATSSSTALGTYSIQVQGTASSVVNSAAMSLVIQAPPDFSFGPATGSLTSQTVAAGQAASFSLALSPSASFTGTVNLTCSITPNASRGPTCSLPSSIQISGSGSQSVSVTVGTTASVTTSSLSLVGLPPSDWQLLWVLMLLGTASLCNPGRKRISALAKTTVLITVLGLVGCGGHTGSSSGSHTTPGTPAGTYTTTITASSGNLSHSTTLTLVVK